MQKIIPNEIKNLPKKSQCKKKKIKGKKLKEKKNIEKIKENSQEKKEKKR